MIYEVKEYGSKTIKNYKINGNKVIVNYINGYYDVIENTSDIIDGLNLVMETQLESFLKEEESIIYAYNKIDKKLNTVSSAIKMALISDLKEISKTLETSKTLKDKLDYFKLCKAYFEHKDELNLDDGKIEVINANNLDRYSEKSLILLAHQKRR